MPTVRTQPINLGSRFLQEQAARRIQTAYHYKLLELGFEWDGQDGYTSPSQEATEAAQAAWKELTNGLAAKG